MNPYQTNSDWPSYQRTTKKRRSYFSLYLLMFGIILGVLLTNTFGPLRKEPEEDRSLAEIQSKSAVSDSVLTDYEKVVISATEKAKPAVVSIYVKGTKIYRYNNPLFDMLYGYQRRKVRSMGSGVIIDPGGTVITNEHVIREAKHSVDPSINIVLPDGRSFPAEIVRDYPKQDIAILSISGDNLPYIVVGSSENVVQGQTVLAIGNPFGVSLTDGFTGGEPTVTRGIISATRRNLTLQQEGETKYFRNMLQTDASINEGNSGGALIDLHGQLIGLNTAVFTQGAGSIGIGFAIPVDRITLILDSVKTGTNIERRKSGIGVESLTNAVAKALDYRGDSGVIVIGVESGSPGEEASFRKGDIITGINGFNIFTVEQASSMFRGAIPGEVFEFKVFRAGAYLDLKLKLGTRD